MFSTRQGGVSEGPFESLNLGRRTGDDVERVDENRRRLCALIDADEGRLTVGFQTHSTVVNRAEAGSRGVPGDGLWTDEPGIPMLTLGADCVLMALARRNGDAPALAVIHAGWRGALARIVPKTIESLIARFGIQPSDLRVSIGPSAGPCCYEIDQAVLEPLRKSRQDWPSLVRDDRGLKARLDLKALVRRQTVETGIPFEQTTVVNVCTICHPALFYSYRREGRVNGTMLNGITLVPRR